MSESKTLIQNGDGLFQTHVQLEDVQELIRDQMNTEARLGEKTKYTVVGDGNGFMSRVILVEPEWTITDENLPKKFILKITSCLHVVGLLEKLKESEQNVINDANEADLMALFENESRLFHNREVNLYKITKKWNKNDELLSPKIYFYKKFDSENQTKGILGMEAVDDVTVRHLYYNVKPFELHSVLKSIARLQAESLHLTDQEKQSIAGFDLKKMSNTIFSEEGMQNNFKQTREINPERLKESVDKVEIYGTELVDLDKAINLNSYIGIERDVLVHGDLWSANILWEENEGKFLVSKVIDYQLIHMGNPAEDLVRLLLCTLSGADRQAHWERLLEQFYEYFLEALQDNETPYSLEQLKESYRQYFVTAGLFMLPMFGPIAQMKLSYSSDNEHAEEYREVLTEKAERLMEDLERWHLHSKNFKQI